MFYKFFVFFFVLAFWGGCSSSDGSSESDDVPYPGADERMRLVEETAETIFLGTNKNGARLDETPKMGVRLDYSYWMDIREVTCTDFKSLMKKSSMVRDIVCEKDSQPVVDVTFYDAVLFANEKSKAEGLDTVYEYSKAVFDKVGHCIGLEAFSFHLERKGFRLPTEAEWVKAASNADKLDIVFSGKVKEFVNDHKGMFENAVVTNYAGASNANESDERVVKGGSSGTASANFYSRGDSYAVTSSTHADYVGFRLVNGSIPDAVFLDQGGQKTNSTLTKGLSALDLWTFTKTSKAKLAFRNDVTGNLVYMDYTNDNSPVEIKDSLQVYHPDISPDGNRVAFCTGFEGVNGASKVYVRNLDPKGSGLVKLDVENAAVPRWSVLEGGDTVITYVSNAGDNSDEANFKGYSTWRVPFANGKFGQPTKLFGGSYHGGVSEDGSLAVTGSKILRARIGEKETVWYNGEQTCNVSLAKDRSKRTAFLDFGSGTGESFVGKKYGVHEYLLVADSTGKLVQGVGAPGGYVFDHSEWATGRVNDNLVATLTNADGAHEKVVLVHLPEGTVSTLVEGDELWHPCLWIRGKNENGTGPSVRSLGSSSDGLTGGSSAAVDAQSSSSLNKIISSFVLDDDSAGFYVKCNEFQEAHWSYKMELIWTYMDKADVAIFGSSRPHHGVIPSLFSDRFFVVNFASGHGNMHSTYYVAVNYVLPHYKKLKAIILDISFDRIYLTKLNSFFYIYAPDIKGYVYDANHDFWKSGVPEGLLERTQDVPKVSSYRANLTERGYMPLSGCSNWYANPRAPRDTAWYDTSLVRLDETFGYLSEIIELSAKKGIKVIGVEFPQNPNYKKVNAYGKYGLRYTDAPKILERVRALEKKYSNFMFFDQHKMGEHDYLEGMNYDDDHLCRAGAEQMTHRLDSLLKTLE